MPYVEKRPKEYEFGYSISTGKWPAESEHRGAQLGSRDTDATAKFTRGWPARPDLLIEYLHLIQDRHGCINADQMVALAHELGLSSAMVYGVASFYHHFDALREGEAALNAMRFFSRESCG